MTGENLESMFFLWITGFQDALDTTIFCLFGFEVPGGPQPFNDRLQVD